MIRCLLRIHDLYHIIHTNGHTSSGAPPPPHFSLLPLPIPFFPLRHSPAGYLPPFVNFIKSSVFKGVQLTAIIFDTKKTVNYHWLVKHLASLYVKISITSSQRGSVMHRPQTDA